MGIEVPKKILNFGDRDEDVKVLHDYLKRFGYIQSDKREVMGARIDIQKATSQPEAEDRFDTNTSKALRRFQEFNKLPVTGILIKLL